MYKIIIEKRGYRRSVKQRSYSSTRCMIPSSAVFLRAQPSRSRSKDPTNATISLLLCARFLRRQYEQQAELYDARGNKPSVLVTSPGSPDLYATNRAASRQFRHPVTVQQAAAGNSVGGRVQVKLSFDASSLQLVVTLVCATGLTPRSNGQPRSSYAKIYLLPDRRYVLIFCSKQFFDRGCAPLLYAG